MTSYTVSVKKYVHFESLYGRQADVDVPKTGLKPEKNNTQNQECSITIQCQIFVVAHFCHATDSPIPMNR